MIPQNLNIDFTEESEVEMPDLTYQIVDGEVVAGTVDGLEAVKQAIAVMLSVERYEHAIYSWQYGAELHDLIGKDIAYVCPELARRITDALLSDERILDVYDFEFSKSGNVVNCNFAVSTIYGETNITKEVEV